MKKRPEPEVVIDPRVLIRDALCTLHPTAEVIQAQGLSKAERKKLSNDSRMLLGMKSLAIVLDHLRCSQRDKIAKEAKPDNLLFAQGVLVGIESVRKQLEALSKTSSTDGEYDKFSPI